MSRKAIEYHLQNIYGKFGISSRQSSAVSSFSRRGSIVCVALGISNWVAGESQVSVRVSRIDNLSKWPKD